MQRQVRLAGKELLNPPTVVRDGNAVLALGSKGAGKTTSALLLTAHGHQLLANNRIFLHPTTRALLPWPAAAALSLGLLPPTARSKACTRLAAGSTCIPPSTRCAHASDLLSARGCDLATAQEPSRGCSLSYRASRTPPESAAKVARSRSPSRHR